MAKRVAKIGRNKNGIKTKLKPKGENWTPGKSGTSRDKENLYM